MKLALYLWLLGALATASCAHAKQAPQAALDCAKQAVTPALVTEVAAALAVADWITAVTDLALQVGEPAVDCAIEQIVGAPGARLNGQYDPEVIARGRTWLRAHGR